MSPSLNESATSDSTNVRVIELDDDVEGEHVDNLTDYFFQKIGEPIPMFKDPSSPVFDLETLPSQGLAVSELFKLTFVAHSSGFYVLRTKDIIDSAVETAKEKGRVTSLQELMFLDVSIGKIHILCLSTDSSTLAVVVGRDIHLFEVNSLLNKELKPLTSCSLGDSSYVKDMRWSNRKENSYVALSNKGMLYHGFLDGSLDNVMDNVDAVDWSVKGRFIAVARNNTLSILSSRFKERLSLSLKSWNGDSADNCTVKVDTIRWIRVDYIVLGCFQRTADGEEENYFLQVITSKDGRITDASSEPVVLSFYNFFTGLADDILSYGSGPYLFFNYLEHCELAIAANRKNTDDHIVLLDWSLDGDKSEVAVVDNLRDKWLPKIHLQENRDDNLILGLCIDKLSVRGKVIVQLGAEEEKELSPYCVVMCLTLDAKLVMFNFASIAGTKVSSEIVSTLLDEENNEAGVPAETQQSSLIKLLSDKTEEEKHMVPSGAQLMEGNCRKEMYFGKVGVIHTAEQMKSLEKNEGRKDTITGNQEVQAQSMINPGEATSKPSLVEGSTHMGRDSSKIDGTKFSLLGSRNAVKFPAESHNQLNANTLRYHSELGKDLPGKNGPTSLQGAFSQSWSSGKPTPSSVYNTSSQITPFGSTSVNKSVTTGASVGAAKVHGRQDLQKDVSGKLTSVNFTAKPSESEGTLKIKEMAKELDLLLHSIEKEGGFADSCTVFLRSSVQAFEDGIGSLSDKCRMWKNVVEEQVREIQHLSDKTIEVLARKVYIEGTIKQACDSNYRDLWDRQKLSSELEQKQRRILKLNQDITNQLVGLERHFNTLELNKFGENAATHAGQRAIQSRFCPSRHVQSLQSLHNTMTSQLAAAEQLSECLTKQMAVLRIQSPVKQKNVKKELFDSIGISYDASFSSPDLKKMVDNSSMKKSMISSVSFSKDQSRRCQSSGMKSTDSETTRRRRDSLDQCWANFEPPKTTVKRLLLQESQRASSSNSPSSLCRHIITPHNQEHSAVTHPNKSTPSTFSYTSGDKGIGDMFSKQCYEKQSTPFKLANDRSEASQSRETGPSIYESGRVFTLSPPQLTPKPVQTLSRSSFDKLEDKSSNGVSKTIKSYLNTVNDHKVELQTEKNLTLKTLAKKPGEFLHSSSEVTVPKNSLVEPMGGTVKSFSFGSGENLDPPNLSHFDVATSKSQSRENSDTFTGSRLGTDTNQNVPLISSSSSTLFSGFNSLVPSSIPVSSTSESQKAELQTSAGMARSKSNLEVPAEPHVSSESLSESTRLVFESHPNFNIAATPNNVLSSAQIERPVANIFPTAPPTVSDSTASRKTENLEVPVTEEDGMEEEAPEVSPTIDLNLSLGTFGGPGNFGLGSTPNPNSLKANPFGGAFGNCTTNQIGSSVPMNVPSGELFRPASFTFQPSQPNPASTSSQAPTLGFGQPAQIGAGQQAMGSVLGSFGQSRQLGAGLAGAGFASASNFGSGFASARPTGGFPSGGGFAGVASTGGGFAGLASGSGGFAGVASAGGGFAAVGASGGGGFGGAASAGGGFTSAGGAGFGAFSNQGTGGFSGFGGSAAGTGGGSAFGGGPGATGKPAELFTQMRR